MPLSPQTPAALGWLHDSVPSEQFLCGESNPQRGCSDVRTVALLGLGICHLAQINAIPALRGQRFLGVA